MNRYTPHYDHDEGTLSMGLDGEGSWVHINSVDARAVKTLEAEVARLKERVGQLWVALSARGHDADCTYRYDNGEAGNCDCGMAALDPPPDPV